jgi:hypothetical protein
VVDIRDVAEAAAISLTEEGHKGKTYDLVSSEMLTGPDAAATWSKLLGKEITYAGDGDFDDFESQLRRTGVPCGIQRLPVGWLTIFGSCSRVLSSVDSATRRTRRCALLPCSGTYSSYAEELATEWLQRKPQPVG